MFHVVVVSFILLKMKWETPLEISPLIRISSIIFFITIVVLYKGWLNTPYIYLKDTIVIKINKKFSKRHKFIFHDIFVKFRKSKLELMFDEPRGILVSNIAYIKERYKCEDWVDHLEKFYNIEYFSDNNNLLEFIEEDDDEETINKKIVLSALKN